MREFEVAVGRAGFTDSKDIPFKLGEDVLTAHCPTVGQLALFLQGGTRGRGIRTITSILEFFSDALNDKDWNIVHTHLRDGLDVNVLSEIATYLIGEWSGRPTKQSSGSGSTRKRTGRSSTVKQPAKASTT